MKLKILHLGKTSSRDVSSMVDELVKRMGRFAKCEVMAIAKFDNLDSCLQYIRSEFYDTVTEEMKSMGCTCMVVQIWDASPVASEPLKPTQA